MFHFTFRCEFGRIHKLEIYCPYMISRTYDIQFKNGILFPKLFRPTVRKKLTETIYSNNESSQQFLRQNAF